MDKAQLSGRLKMIFNERRRTVRGLSNKTTKKERNNKSFTVRAEQKCAKNLVGGGEWEMGEERVGDERWDEKYGEITQQCLKFAIKKWLNGGSQEKRDRQTKN